MLDKPEPKQINNTKDLRGFLLEQLQSAANGKLNTERAKSVCNISQQIYNTLNVEIKMAVAKGKVKDGEINAIDFD